MRLQQELIGRVALTALLLLPGQPAWAARMLFVFPYDMQSQCMLLTPYLRELLDRGHEVTMIHAFSNCEIVKHLHSIHIDERYVNTYDFSGEYFYMSKWFSVDFIRKFFVDICLNVLNTAEVQELMQSKVTFDLMVIEPSYTDALFGLGVHFNATIIGLATCGADWNLETLVGHTPFGKMEPLMPLDISTGTSLLDRLRRWIYISEEWLMHQLIFLPSLRAIHDHFFGHLKESFTDIRQSFALIFLNQHFSLFPARSNVPSLVEVGGMHVPKVVPQLTPPLAQFVGEAPHGVIVVSMGADMQSFQLKDEIKEIMAETFAALPERVIWKYEDETYPKGNHSIFFSKEIHLQALLAHPNVRLLINNGGILSILEAAHYGKPVLGLPLLFDQFRNMNTMREKGGAEVLHIHSMSKRDFLGTIRKLLDEPQYKHNAIQLSQRIRDQPMHPLDLAVYWTEYVLRHRGAPYMRISPLYIKLVDYYCLDNLLVIVVRICLPLLLLFYLLYRVIRKT